MSAWCSKCGWQGTHDLCVMVDTVNGQGLGCPRCQRLVMEGTKFAWPPSGHPLANWRVWLAGVGLAAIIIGIVLLTGCVPSARWVPPFSDMVLQQRDLVECSALAGQASAGTGAMFSDRAWRAGYEAAARENYQAKCLASRGWTLTGAR